MKEYAKDFYKSDAWKKARVAVIKRANGLCERCRAAGQYKPGVIVHHKKYITPGNIHDARVTVFLPYEFTLLSNQFLSHATTRHVIFPYGLVYNTLIFINYILIYA